MGVDFFVCDICDEIEPTSEFYRIEIGDDVNRDDDLNICPSCWEQKSEYFVKREPTENEKIAVLAKSGYRFWTDSPENLGPLCAWADEEYSSIYGWVDNQKMVSKGYKGFADFLNAAAAQYEREAGRERYRATPELEKVMTKIIDRKIGRLKTKKRKLK